jgi:hypothetical protein
MIGDFKVTCTRWYWFFWAMKAFLSFKVGEGNGVVLVAHSSRPLCRAYLFFGIFTAFAMRGGFGGERERGV